MESSESVYHVVNRGNHRSFIFKSGGQYRGSQAVGALETGDCEQNESGDLGFEQVAERAVAPGPRAGSEQQLRALPKAARSALPSRQTTEELYFCALTPFGVYMVS